MAKANYSDLKAVYLNCTLKRSPDVSHTQYLIDKSAAIMEAQGVSVAHVKPVDHDIAFGMSPDMTKEGWDKDAWPRIQKQIMDADILVIGTPIWLGVKSSVATMAIERLYSNSGKTNEKGQYLYYGKTGGCLVTGNEDGVKACAMETLYALQHIGNRNTTFTTWNLLHTARMLKDAGGFPSHGNIGSEWESGNHFDFPNPEYQ